MKHIYLFNNASRAAQYGIGTYIKQLCSCLAGKPDILLRITIVAINSEEKEITKKEENGIATIYIPEITYQNTENNYHRYYRNLAYILAVYVNNKEYNIFLLNYLFMSPIAGELKRQWPDCKIFVSVHYLNWCFVLNGNTKLFHQVLANDNPEKKEYQALYEEYLKDKELFRQADKVICLSEYTFKLLKNDYQVAPSKIALIYNGLQDEYMPISDNKRLELKQTLGFKTDESIILFVGRLDSIKGLDWLIKAFHKVLETKSNVNLLVVGNGNYDTYLKECTGMRNKITFTGKVAKEELYNYYKIADMGVMPSFHEQCSYVAIEMMMHGIPLIGTNTTGLGEMLDENLKVELNENSESMLSTEALALLINKVLQCPNNELRKRSRNKFKELYTIEHMQKQYLRLININI